MPYDTVQNRKNGLSGTEKLKAFTCTSFLQKLLMGETPKTAMSALFCTEPHSLSFQGALPLGDWVFKAVAYPIRYTLIIHIFRDYGKNKTTTTFTV